MTYLRSLTVATLVILPVWAHAQTKTPYVSVPMPSRSSVAQKTNPFALELSQQDKDAWRQIPQVLLICVGMLKTKNTDDVCAGLYTFLTQFSQRVQTAEPAKQPEQSPESK
jgi:hypothetical protein